MNLYNVLIAKKLSGGGGGGSSTLIDKNISVNGTYNASSDSADGYKKVVVNVPNPSTGTISITTNGTVDVTNYASADVNVPTNEWIKKDGKTHLYIDIFNDVYLTINMMFGQTIASGNKIDWGDGTSTTPSNTSSALQTHTYAQKGEYEIVIENTSGYFYFGQDGVTKGYIFQDGTNNAYQEKYIHFCSILKKMELGKGWKSDYGRQFSNCKNLSEVYVNTKTDQTTFNSRMFEGCVRLNKFDGVAEFFNGITTLGVSNFYNSSLQEMPKFPNATTIPSKFIQSISNTDSSLREADIWEGVTTIDSEAFRAQINICEITVPSTVTTINANAFNSCFGVHEIHVLATTPPTLSNTNAIPSANNTYDLKIYVPSASLADYQSASNWSDFSSYMIGE